MVYFISFAFVIASFIAVAYIKKRTDSLSISVFSGLILGGVFGAILNYTAQSSYISPSQLSEITGYLNVVKKGYIGLLYMIILPLILVSIINAILKLGDNKVVGRISFSVIGILLLTTAASAVVGIICVQLFDLGSMHLVLGDQEVSRIAQNASRNENLSNQSFSDLIISFFPNNIFRDLSEMRTIAVVIFSSFMGLSFLIVTKKNPEYSDAIHTFSEVSSQVIKQLVRLVLSFTPFGIFAAIAILVAKTDTAAIVDLARFVIASYFGLLLILVIHLVLLAFVGVSPISYLKKVAPVLAFAFSSRSSAATMPINIDTQVNKLHNNVGVANFSAGFGATLGQNACAGLYPAMLVMMVAPSFGVDIDLFFFTKLVLIITISSLGIAGIGGGATNAGLIVLGTLGLPIEIVGLLISIEPLIDMGRTAVNVSGSITSGTITSKILQYKF